MVSVSRSVTYAIIGAVTLLVVTLSGPAAIAAPTGADTHGGSITTAGQPTAQGNATATAQLTVVKQASGPGDVTGNGQAATDPDGDGLYEDVNGDGVADLQDVAAFKSYLNTTQSNRPLGFDFNGDGQVGLIDVQPLRNEVAPGSGGSGGSTGPGDLTGNGQAATDPDGDGLYEDVNGDGTANLQDVRPFFSLVQPATTTPQTSALDFNGDGTNTLQDVRPFFTEVAP